MYKIYCLACPISCKIRYIGITSQDPIVRKMQHIYQCRSNCKKNSYKIDWLKSINCNPLFKVLKIVNSLKEARNLELKLIDKYKISRKLVNLKDKGYNSFYKEYDKKIAIKISNTLKYKYTNNLINIKGEKPVYVFNKNGKFINEYESCSECARNMSDVPFRKIGQVANNKMRYYTNYTFSYTNKFPEYKYFKIVNIITNEIHYFLKKEDIRKFLNIKHDCYNNRINNGLYLKKYLITYNWK
jgi:hypothetical protein